jgi:hypothetical protein
MNAPRADFKSPLPRRMDMTVLAPEAHSIDSPKMKLMNGMAMLTDASAIGPTPRATKKPSVIEYSEYSHIDMTDGIAYSKNLFFKIKPPPLLSDFFSREKITAQSDNYNL